jgi:HSP20 family protein
MEDVTVALSEAKDLYYKAFGKSAPEIEPHAYVPFPAGVDPIGFAVEEVRQVKKLAEASANAPPPIAWMPRADAIATRDGIVFQVEVPGLTREEVKVFSTGREVVVRGERKGPVQTAECRALGLERPWGAFERRFALPPGSQPEKVTARYAQGVLEIKVVGMAMGIPGEKPVEVV